MSPRKRFGLWALACLLLAGIPVAMAVPTSRAFPTAGVPTSRTISTTAPLAGGGDLSANRTFSISAATSSAAGSMSAADKGKLDASFSAVQNLSGAGAVSLTARTTRLTASAPAQALTLADGSFVGQRKSIRAKTVAGGNTQILTPATFADGSTIAFDASGQWIELEWQTGGWIVVAHGGPTNGAGPTVS